MKVRFDYLANYPEYIPTVAQWYKEAWGHYDPELSLEGGITKLKKYMANSEFGIVVAIAGDTIVGTGRIVRHDMDTDPDLTPWLSGLYVTRAFRKKGIGTALVKQIVEEAKTRGIKVLYLFTPNRESFYARLGWQIRCREEYHGEGVVVMELHTGA